MLRAGRLPAVPAGQCLPLGKVQMEQFPGCWVVGVFSQFLINSYALSSAVVAITFFSV